VCGKLGLHGWAQDARDVEHDGIPSPTLGKIPKLVL
jgi:hypothetical protein